MTRGEVSGRFDPKYYLSGDAVGADWATLGELVSQEPGYGAPARAIARGQGDPRYIRITDFGDDGVPEGHNYLTADSFDPKFEMSLNDLLFARSGATVGKTYLHEDTTEPAVFAGYCIRFVFDPTRVDPRFVYWWTKTEVYATWVARTQRPSGQPNINKEEFKACPIPLPAPEEQGRLVAEMDGARKDRRFKLAAAEGLLSGMTDFVAQKLNLGPQQPPSAGPYSVTLEQARSDRKLNADFFHPERSLTMRALRADPNLATESLDALVDFVRDQIKQPEGAYLGLAAVQSHTGELTGVEETVSGACSVFQPEDVLFARLRPYLNKVYRAERSGCCSPEFHVLRVKPDVVMSPDYLAVILRSRLVLAQTIHMMTGNTHPRLANEDVTALLIPVPSPEIQTEIVAEDARRRAEARRLRTEAEAEWRDAKAAFEAALLGGAAA